MAAHQGDIETFFEAAVSIAREAGKVVKEAFYKDKDVQTKECGTDLVTETDQKVEKLIFGKLKERFPTHSFIGEESVAAGDACTLTDDPTWIVDPVDGTTNFVHRYPLVAVSIALAINKEVEIGVVYSCILDEMFAAKRGHGAFCNGEKLQASSVTEIGKSIIISEVGSKRDKIDIVMKNLKKLAEEPDAVHSIRLHGSAAINLCYVAKGRADAYFEFGIHCWDIAAGILIVTEAGGTVLNSSGGPLDIMIRQVIAAGTESLARKICQTVEPIQFPRD